MKQIRRGKRNPNHPWVANKIDCINCDYSGMLEKGDKVKFVEDSRDGDYYKVKCPNCGHGMTLAASLCI